MPSALHPDPSCSPDTDRDAQPAPPGWLTGLGVVSPIGLGLGPFTQALREGRSGVGPLWADANTQASTQANSEAAAPRTARVEGLRSTAAARCIGFDPASVVGQAEAERLPRVVPMALAAAKEALGRAGLLDDSGRVRDGLSRRVGLILGTGGGGIDFTLAQAWASAHGGRPSLWSVTNATHGNLAGELSIQLGLRGPSLCLSTGCASGADAAGMALEQLRGRRPGSPDAWLVIGADAHIEPWVLRSMELLKVISTRDWSMDPAGASTASRPFDSTRDGFVLGEGAYAAVIERPRFARERGAPPPVAALLGYGATCDAYHRVRPDPSMAECVRAMGLALEDAGRTPAGVDLVHYHGTGTRLNDAAETAAVRALFGDHAPRLIGSSVKGAIGHPQGASAMASLVATAAALADPRPFAVPTLNLRQPDPDCDLDYTPLTARALEPGRPYVALVNCLAFGAKNSALIIASAPA